MMISEMIPDSHDTKNIYFCGLIQKMFCFFRRDKAKLVPIVRVAGRAGGTTIVIRSSALIMMRCQASC